MGGNRDFPGDTAVKNSPVMQEIQVPSLGQEDTLEEEMATTPVFLPGKISWTGKPGGLQSIEEQRVGHSRAQVGLREPIKVAEFDKEENMIFQEDMVFLEPLGTGLPHRSCHGTQLLLKFATEIKWECGSAFSGHCLL